MGSQSDPRDVRFEPLRPASRGQVVVAFIVGPILWLAALSVGAVVFTQTKAIAVGSAVAVASFLIALIVLNVLLSARRREERRYDAR